AGIPSVGVEMHPLVAWVARIKTSWDIDPEELKARGDELLARLGAVNLKPSPDGLPALVRKCYSADNLRKLVSIREAIEAMGCENEIKDFLRLALVDTLRTASSAGTGWPYIAPTRYHGKTVEDRGTRCFGRVQKDPLRHDSRFGAGQVKLPGTRPREAKDHPGRRQGHGRG
ncbi:MAG: hypothetical protein ACPL68_07945, partial [Candidatus Hydrothermia bacterium]